MPVKVKKNNSIKIKIKANLEKSLVDFSWDIMNQSYTTKKGIRLKERSINDVVAFILFDKGKVLVEKRKSTKKIDPQKIVVPGGHVERGESLLDACKREVKEELNVNGKNFKFICRSVFDAGSEIEIIHYFLCQKWEGKIKAKEAQRLMWLDKDNLDKLSYQIDRDAVNKIWPFYHSQ